MRDAASSTPAAPAPIPAPAALALQRAAIVAAAFCFLVLASLAIRHVQSRQADPWKSPELLALKERLTTQPKDEALKEQIRHMDLELRQRYFQHQTFSRYGAWLLLGGAIVLVALSKRAVAAVAQPYLPPTAGALPGRSHDPARRTQWTLAFACAALILTGAALVLGSASLLPRSDAALERLLSRRAGGDEELPVPSPEVASQQWPRFLGPLGNSCSTNARLPERIDPATGDGIAWKTPILLPGFNSPLVWSNRVFLAGADATNRAVIAFDAESGALLWQRPAPPNPAAAANQVEVSEGTGYAASTMATDGLRVYAFFATGDLAAFRFDGTLAWSKHLGPLKNQYGHATSLITWQGRLILQLDQGQAEQGRSRLYAIDGATGRVVWERTRLVPESWATPLLVDTANRPQIVTLGGQWVIAYAANDGTEIWRADLLTGEIAPSPIVAGPLVLVVSPNDRLIALRPDGQGDVTKTHMAWYTDETAPDISSPASNGEFVFSVATFGMLTCIRLDDGKKVWEQDLGMEVHASPAIVGNELLLLGRKGAGIIAAAAAEYRERIRFDLGEAVDASPALAGGAVFLRTQQHLIRFGRPAGTSSPTP
ncbi:MAG TPA: PQQ-binding-like beta-propeller repeat protein [Verrucomicrobiota bacterium]|nr:PQQ-binding-like beta-propeller repeat protein [Verrucomicrobiota bacterium]HNU50414.1 PQQ-binding-like beta-propeller repeat protein [Verrucomicrobiota bacterium]